MHLTFEGRQDGNKSGSRDRPTGQECRRPERPSRAFDRPALQAQLPVFSVFAALVHRRKTDALPLPAAAVSSSGRWPALSSSESRASCLAAGRRRELGARSDVRHTMSRRLM